MNYDFSLKGVQAVLSLAMQAILLLSLLATSDSLVLAIILLTVHNHFFMTSYNIRYFPDPKIYTVVVILSI